MSENLSLHFHINRLENKCHMIILVNTEKSTGERSKYVGIELYQQTRNRRKLELNTSYILKLYSKHHI